MTTLLLVGATGLVGQAVLRQALADARVTAIVAPTRRPLPAHPKLANPQVDFAALPADADWWTADAIVCTLGTTMRKAGSQAAFRAVDHDYPLRVAEIGRRHGVRTFVLLTSVGAAASARTFYLRVKGEIEQAVTALDFPSLTIVRPSLIGGRRAESRPAERAAMRAFGVLGPLIPKRYRMVPAETLAAVLLDAAIAARPGRQVIESERMQD